MKKFVTLIQAIDPKDGNLKTFYERFHYLFR